MNDLIERDKAINILDRIDVDIIPYADTRECVQIAIDHIRKELEELPSADAVSREDYEVMQFCFEQMKSLTNKLAHNARPKGEWIYTNNPLRLDDEWECSRCGNISFMRTNFCARCGAHMKGVDDERQTI